jgi:hypothetical protein
VAHAIHKGSPSTHCNDAKFVIDLGKNTLPGLDEDKIQGVRIAGIDDLGIFLGSCLGREYG